MEIGTIIGIVVTIVIAVISSRSGKAKVYKNPQPQDYEQPVDIPESEQGSTVSTFQEFLRELGIPQEKPAMTPGERSLELEKPIYETLENANSYDDLAPMENASSLETIPPIPQTNYGSEKSTHTKYKNVKRSPAISMIAGQEGDDDDIDTAHEKQKAARRGVDDFDLRKAVIYSEILHPRHLDY